MDVVPRVWWPSNYATQPEQRRHPAEASPRSLALPAAPQTALVPRSDVNLAKYSDGRPEDVRSLSCSAVGRLRALRGPGSDAGAATGRAAEPAVGRAYEQRRAARGRGLLVCAGQAALSDPLAAAGHRAIEDDLQITGGLEAGECEWGQYTYQPYQSTSIPATPECAPRDEEELSRAEGCEAALDGATRLLSKAERLSEVCVAPQTVTDQQYALPYKLPKDPADVYKRQSDMDRRIMPSGVIFEVNRQACQAPKAEPFQRVLRKLPEHARPSAEGPSCGPLGNPNEPVWFEMGHRLHHILKKAEKRGERRKKRKLRSKLRGRAMPRKQDEGRNLRQYLDERAAEHAQGGSAGDSEFLGKIEEKRQLSRSRLEAPKPFRAAPSGKLDARLYGIGEFPTAPSERQRPVRPVYIPPPLPGVR